MGKVSNAEKATRTVLDRRERAVSLLGGEEFRINALWVLMSRRDEQ